MWTVFGGAIADRGDQRISNRYCHGDVKINMMGICDGHALSVNLPWLHKFDNSFITIAYPIVFCGYHALALMKTRGLC